MKTSYHHGTFLTRDKTMPRKTASRCTIKVNRAPVLTLWAAVVAERLGFNRDEAITLGRALAGLNAYSKGVSLGLFTPTPKEVKEKRKKLRAEETITVDLLHRAVLAVQTEAGLRALAKDRPIDPASVQRDRPLIPTLAISHNWHGDGLGC